jgi:hypothetical protein
MLKHKGSRIHKERTRDVVIQEGQDVDLGRCATNFYM